VSAAPLSVSAAGGSPAREDARRQERAASILIAAAAHDLRTPLNTMVGWLQILQSAHDLPTATRERAFRGLQSAVAQQAALAEGLAHIAAVHTDDMALEIGPLDLGDALGTALHSLEAEAQAKVVELELVVPEAPVQLRSDQALLGVLLRHCLGGALKFAAKNSRMLAGVVAGTGGDVAAVVRVEIEASLLPAAGIAAILRYSEGLESVKPSGASAVFAFAVTQELAHFLGGTAEVAAAADGKGVRIDVSLRSQP
jgi:signal transduction histidine kinase